MPFNVLISESARDELYSLDEETKNRVKKSFDALKENPFRKRSGADIKKLEGSANPALYRLRVGDYRIVYSIINQEVRITKIIHRGKGYNWLD
jgi:mRNA interferase RelE/StbE